MTGLRVFESNDFGHIRVVTQEGSSWFVATDICRALLITDTWGAVSRLDDDEKGTGLISTPGGPQQMTIINESGLYSLVLSSRKPEAKAFKRWITHEVIPAIRKTGGYFAGEEIMSEEELLSRALQVAANKIKKRDNIINGLEWDNAILSSTNRLLQPKADYFDAAMNSSLLTGIRETAKLFGIGQKQLVSFLLENKYAYRNKKGNLLPFDRKNKGYFEVKEVQSANTGWFIIMFRFTPKGRAHIFQRLNTRIKDNTREVAK